MSGARQGVATLTEAEKASRIYTLPNAMTAFRILMSAALGLVFLTLPRPTADVVALVLFLAGAVTDYLDGVVARRFGLMSDLGRALDTIADKTLVFAAFLALIPAAPDWANPWLILMFLLVALRDFIVSGMREAVGTRGVVLGATWTAKAKTALQMVALPTLIAAPLAAAHADLLYLLGMWLLAVSTALTVWTGAGYVSAALRALGSVKEAR